MKTILVTAQEYGKGRPVFEQASSEGIQFVEAPEEEAALADRIGQMNATGVIVGVQRYVDALYEALPEGGIIARFGVGHDGVDKKKAARKGIRVTNTPGVLDVSVAEHAICLMMALARDVPRHDRQSREGDWDPRRGLELRGKTLSLIGFGRIARETASIAAAGLRMNIVACDVAPENRHSEALDGLRKAGATAAFTSSLSEALARGDVVSIHLPLLDSTRDIIDRLSLSQMAPSSFLVNTSRGGIVDENALFDALAEGRLEGAAFDVFREEPYRPADPARDLRTLSNMLMTPHISSNTDMSNRRMAERCVQNVLAFLEGHTSEMDIVN